MQATYQSSICDLSSKKKRRENLLAEPVYSLSLSKSPTQLCPSSFQPSHGRALLQKAWDVEPFRALHSSTKTNQKRRGKWALGAPLKSLPQNSTNIALFLSLGKFMQF